VSRLPSARAADSPACIAATAPPCPAADAPPSRAADSPPPCPSVCRSWGRRRAATVHSLVQLGRMKAKHGRCPHPTDGRDRRGVDDSRNAPARNFCSAPATGTLTASPPTAQRRWRHRRWRRGRHESRHASAPVPRTAQRIRAEWSDGQRHCCRRPPSCRRRPIDSDTLANRKPFVLSGYSRFVRRKPPVAAFCFGLRSRCDFVAPFHLQRTSILNSHFEEAWCRNAFREATRAIGTESITESATQHSHRASEDGHPMNGPPKCNMQASCVVSEGSPPSHSLQRLVSGRTAGRPPVTAQWGRPCLFFGGQRTALPPQPPLSRQCLSDALCRRKTLHGGHLYNEDACRGPGHASRTGTFRCSLNVDSGSHEPM